jgi:hypothetical protein
MKKRLPVVRGDCIGAERPCAHYSCRYNLVHVGIRRALRSALHDLGVDGDADAILDRVDRAARETPSCGLDLADIAERYGGLTQSDVAWYLGLFRQEIVTIERDVYERCRAFLEKSHGPTVESPVRSALQRHFDRRGA